MTLKTIGTGSSGNCYILTSDTGKHLILDAGIILPEIKKGLDFDIGNVEGCLVTHNHLDHAKTATWIKSMGIRVFEPYKDAEHKQLRTTFGEFSINSFDVPHNGCENRAFLISVNGTKVLYMTDYEYCPYSLEGTGINVALVEMNYQSEKISDMDEHRRHTILGHAEEKTTIELLSTIKKSLRTVVLCHMSRSGMLDRDLAMEHVREAIPEYINVKWAKPGEIVDISEIPF